MVPWASSCFLRQEISPRYPGVEGGQVDVMAFGKGEEVGVGGAGGGRAPVRPIYAVHVIGEEPVGGTQ